MRKRKLTAQDRGAGGGKGGGEASQGQGDEEGDEEYDSDMDLEELRRHGLKRVSGRPT
jgi:hypothetical protein